MIQLWVASRYGVTDGDTAVFKTPLSKWNHEQLALYLNELERVAGEGYVQQLKTVIDLKRQRA